MGPIRGRYRKKRKLEMLNVGHKVLGSGSFDDGSVDWWNEFHKRISVLLSPSKDLDMFEFVFKISRRTFSYICSLVMEPMMANTRKYSFTNGSAMSLHDRVALALRRLKSGDSLVSLGQSFGTHRSTVSQVTWSFVEALEEKGISHLQWPATEDEMLEIKAKFESIQGLPNCCGAVDITHIKMMSSTSPLDNKVWLDNMENQSMLLQVVVDPDMRFRDVVSGWPGNMTDSSVLSSSTFFELCEKGDRLNGNKIKLSDGSELNEYIIGDSGFPSLPWLVTPYQEKKISESRANFNKRHFETWMVAHRALSRLKEGWKVIQGVMWRPDKHKLPRVMLACCILHNILIDMEDEVHELPPFCDHDPDYPQEVHKSDKKTSSALRDELSLYLSGKLKSQVGRASDYRIG